MPNINYEAELAGALLTQIQLERDMRLIRESYSKLMAENQYLREQGENHSAIIRGKNESLKTIIRERDSLKASESNFRNLLRGLREHPKLLAQYRERMKLIHDLSRPYQDEQVSEASGESNLAAQAQVPIGGELRNDRKASTAVGPEDAQPARRPEPEQDSPYRCSVCGART